jgi:uncharacterized protein YgbK (DUF1537 family)
MFHVWADDLTGACDCATVLGLHGLSAWVSLGVGASHLDLKTQDLGTKAQAHCLNLNTRQLSHPLEVFECVINALEAHSGETPYLKMDSTWRGYPVATALAVMQKQKSPFVFCCPAFPAQGRLIRQGQAFLHGTALHETPLAHDPHHPIYTADIKTLLHQEAQRLGKTMTVWTAEDHHLSRIESGDFPPNTVIVPDVASSSDLRKWVEVLKKVTPAPVFMGSAGLLDALSQANGGSDKACSIPVFEGVFSPVQVVSGSLNPITLRQIAHLKTHHPHVPILNTAEWGQVKDWHARLIQRYHSEFHTPHRTTVLCGGDTAHTILAELGIHTLQWQGALNPLCSVWRSVEEPHQKHTWILKSGNMGEESLLTELCDAFSLSTSKHL